MLSAGMYIRQLCLIPRGEIPFFCRFDRDHAGRDRVPRQRLRHRRQRPPVSLLQDMDRVPGTAKLYEHRCEQVF